MVSRKSSIIGRWDKGVYKKMKELLPTDTDAERSRKLFKMSLFGAESGLRSIDEQLSRSLKKSKKGSITDLIYYVSIMFFIGFIVLMGAKVAGEFNSGIQNTTNVNLSASETQVLDNIAGQYYSSIDNAVLFLAIGLAIVTLILAALVKIHPIFIPLYLIGEVFIIIVSAVASNIYQTAASDSTLSGVASQLTFTGLVLTYLPIFVGVIGTLIMIVMYKTWSADQ